MSRILLTLGTLFLLLSSTFAQQTADANALVQRLERSVRLRDDAIAYLQQRVQTLEAELSRLQSPRSAMLIPAVATSAAPAPTPAPNPSPVIPATTASDEEERSARAALDRTLVSRGGILLSPWTMEVEHSYSYYNASSDNISIDGFSIMPVLVVGDIVSERIRRDIMRASATARLGLPRDFQLEVRMPFGYESERRVTAENKQTSTHALGIGDLEVAVMKQVLRQKNGWPDLLAGVRWKSTTGRDPFRVGKSEPALGTGFNSIQASITAVKTSDPAVFFGGLSYTANLSSSKGVMGLNPDSPYEIAMGSLNPGDTIGFNLGTALALNTDASISFGWDQRFTRTGTLNRMRIPGSFMSEGMLRIGTTYAYTAGRTIDVNLGIGMTRDTPDFQFTVAFPIRLSARRLPRLLGFLRPAAKPAIPPSTTTSMAQLH
jgi:hypothetical protein